MSSMLATVFHGVNDIRVDSVPKPSAGAGEAVLRITATTSAAPTSTSSAASIR
jgi:hypothetical protein